MTDGQEITEQSKKLICIKTPTTPRHLAEQWTAGFLLSVSVACLTQPPDTGTITRHSRISDVEAYSGAEAGLPSV